MKKNYDPVPQWWFYTLLLVNIALALVACEGFGQQLQLPYWGVLLAVGLALFFMLPVGIITATTNTVCLSNTNEAQLVELFGQNKYDHWNLLCAASRIECHNGAHNRVHVPRKTTCKYHIQNVWYDELVTGTDVSGGFQARPLHENPPKVDVYGSGELISLTTLFSLICSATRLR